MRNVNLRRRLAEVITGDETWVYRVSQNYRPIVFLSIKY